jgi:valyl-tRNA synthetase
MTQIPKVYNAKDYEQDIYKQWEKSGAFTPKIDPKKKPFTISLPPPNATGQLHLGHAMMLAIEDIMVRYHRMKGHPTLWLPGTDHAAIATQNKVEKIIAEEGTDRHTMGRTKFLSRVKKYVAGSQDTIRNQIRQMGASIDWTRERYTMDDQLTRAVRAAFLKMYKDGLIYRGPRIVNWCTRCGSTLADDELEYREEKSKFYYLKYGPVVIGTARPETKFHDKIIIVHPKDKRYKDLIGKELDVPWITGTVKAKFVADECADMEMGSGAMTITPAHSFVDFDLAKKYDFEITQIINEKGEITEAGGPEFEGLHVKDAREKVVKELDEKGLLESIDEEYVHNLSCCYRCGTAVEPLISEQWFIDVNKEVRGKTLKERALAAVRKGDIEILPDRFNKVYFHWIENLRDWCISRQIWWGHRIPVWHCSDKKCKHHKEPIVSLDDPTECPTCKNSKLKQDPDTLDTWFSSGLWTFSTLGWPEKTKDLQYFHPTSVLETGYDIIFFWVARMILMTTYLLDDVPFETVYLHGLIRDKQGRKMSKSLGNGIDPLDMIEMYGADAVRLSLVLGSSPGNDLRVYEEKIAGYRNFVNKIWNSARYVLMNLEKEDFHAEIDPDSLSRADKWILHRLNQVTKEATKNLDKYSLSEVGMGIYDFFWSEYCDWYLEISKIKPNKAVLAHVLKTVLKLLHPYTPYVTEVLWEKMDQKTQLITEEWPKPDPMFNFNKASGEMQMVINVVKNIRQLRADYKLKPGQKLKATFHGEKIQAVLKDNMDIIMSLAKLENPVIEKEEKEKKKKVPGTIVSFAGPVKIKLMTKGIVNLDKEKARLKDEIQNLTGYIKGLENKLKNEGYLHNAPRPVVEADKARYLEGKERLEKIKKQLNSLG